MRSLAERFWGKVDKSGECWVWTAGRSRLGYGRITIAGKPAESHRVSWELVHGAIPADAHVLHSCDNRACVNPAHLRLGTHAENMRDMSARGRWAGRMGAEHHFARFTPDEVRALREAHASGTPILQLAKRHGVAFNAMWRLVRRLSWKHVA